MKRVLIFIHDGFADYELSYVSSFLRNSKEAEIKFMSPGSTDVISKAGLQIKADIILDNSIVAADYDALLLIGGRFWRSNNFSNEVLSELVGDFIRENKIVAAICDASTYLAYNGFLNYHKHTGNGKKYFVETCPAYDGLSDYVEEQCVVDLPFITANGTAGIEFGEEVCKALNILKEEDRKAFFGYHKDKLY